MTRSADLYDELSEGATLPKVGAAPRALRPAGRSARWWCVARRRRPYLRSGAGPFCWPVTDLVFLPVARADREQAMRGASRGVGAPSAVERAAVGHTSVTCDPVWGQILGRARRSTLPWRRWQN